MALSFHLLSSDLFFPFKQTLSKETLNESSNETTKEFYDNIKDYEGVKKGSIKRTNNEISKENVENLESIQNNSFFINKETKVK